MRSPRLKVLASFALLTVGLGYVWAEPQPIPQEIAVQIGKQIADLAGQDAKAVVKIDADAEKSTGLYEQGSGGLIIMPIKGIKDGSELKGVEAANGAGAGYLFLHKLTLVVDGKPLAADKFAAVTFKDPEGNERSALTLRLTMKKEGNEKWTLLVFGKDGKPLVSAPFRAEKNSSDMPFSVGAKDISGDQGTLVVTYVGKYAADLRLAKAE